MSQKIMSQPFESSVLLDSNLFEIPRQVIETIILPKYFINSDIQISHRDDKDTKERVKEIFDLYDYVTQNKKPETLTEKIVQNHKSDIIDLIKKANEINLEIVNLSLLYLLKSEKLDEKLMNEKLKAVNDKISSLNIDRKILHNAFKIIKDDDAINNIKNALNEFIYEITDNLSLLSCKKKTIIESSIYTEIKNNYDNYNKKNLQTENKVKKIEQIVEEEIDLQNDGITTIALKKSFLAAPSLFNNPQLSHDPKEGNKENQIEEEKEEEKNLDGDNAVYNDFEISMVSTASKSPLDDLNKMGEQEIIK